MNLEPALAALELTVPEAVDNAVKDVLDTEALPSTQAWMYFAGTVCVWKDTFPADSADHIRVGLWYRLKKAQILHRLGHEAMAVEDHVGIVTYLHKHVDAAHLPDRFIELLHAALPETADA